MVSLSLNGLSFRSWPSPRVLSRLFKSISDKTFGPPLGPSSPTVPSRATELGSEMVAKPFTGCSRPALSERSQQMSSRTLPMPWRDVVGGRSKTLQTALLEARRTCLAEMSVQAAIVGADAVVGIDLDYSEFSSSVVSGGMLFVASTGTAVRLVPSH